MVGSESAGSVRTRPSDLTRSNPLTHVDLCQQRNDERVHAVSKVCIKEGEVWTSRVLRGKAVEDVGDVGDVRVEEAARRTLYLGGVIMPRLAMILDLPISIGYRALFTRNGYGKSRIDIENSI